MPDAETMNKSLAIRPAASGGSIVPAWWHAILVSQQMLAKHWYIKLVLEFNPGTKYVNHRQSEDTQWRFM